MRSFIVIPRTGRFAKLGVAVRVFLLALAVCGLARSLGNPITLEDDPGTSTVLTQSGPQQLLKGSQDPVSSLKTISNLRVQAMVDGNERLLTPLFDSGGNYGRWALEHDRRKIKYLRAWSENRGIEFTGAKSNLKIRSVEVTGDTAWIDFTQITRLTYVYSQNRKLEQTFSIGVRHHAELARSSRRWVIRKDWCTDPLDEDTLVMNVTPAVGAYQVREVGASGKTPVARMQVGVKQGRFNRQQAVAYANKYCGAAGSDRYNSKYLDYTGRGGDCTNFASQVLTDSEAGGLPTDSAWHYDFKSDAGTVAWVQAEEFMAYLERRGLTALVARGTFTEVTKVTPEHRFGAIGELAPGDLIGYEEKGHLEHFSIVSGTDALGTVLVNSHTADRYRVPWDIGWDRNTVFWLLRIKD